MPQALKENFITQVLEKHCSFKHLRLFFSLQLGFFIFKVAIIITITIFINTIININ